MPALTPFRRYGCWLWSGCMRCGTVHTLQCTDFCNKGDSATRLGIVLLMVSISRPSSVAPCQTVAMSCSERESNAPDDDWKCDGNAIANAGSGLQVRGGGGAGRVWPSQGAAALPTLCQHT
jgi:hypothetical protein